jgi:hypothetical protein
MQCSYKRVDGSDCPAYAVEGTDPPACTFHSPLVSAERRRELKAMGGRRPAWVASASEVGMGVEDIMQLVNEVVTNLRSMPQDTRTAGAMIQVANLLLNILDTYEMGNRAAELEELLRSIQGGTSGTQ